MRRHDVLYVTRKFPPSVGGMENLAYEFSASLERAGSPHVIALGRGQRNLAWFLPVAALRTLVALVRERTPTVLVGDPVVMIALWPVLALRRRTRVILVVHGLDLTLPKRLYRTLVRFVSRRADLVIAISAATKREAIALGMKPDRIDIVLPGLPAPAPLPDVGAARADVQARAGLDADDVVIATIGRLVPRKGQAWFAREVLPLLSTQYRYVVAGDGPDRETIRAAAAAAGVGDRCVLLGGVDDAGREAILAGADVFAVPNVAVPGDMEGFGLVAAEASLRGTPVVAARLEGLTDAVVDGVTGAICEPGDATGFAAAIRAVAEGERGDPAQRDAVAAAAADRFGIPRFDLDLARVLAKARALDATGEVTTDAANDADTRSHAVLDPESRRRKARKLVAIVSRRRDLRGTRTLEVGTGSGVMASEIATVVGPAGLVCSVDVRDERLEGTGFDFVRVGDARLPFADRSFDVVISNHVIEHVGDRSEQLRHLRELHRVLRPDGLVYLAVPNKWGLLEPHYRLPILSWMPRRAADAYLRVSRKGTAYDVLSPSRRVLRDLAARADLTADECSLEALRVLADLERPALALRLIARVPTPLLRLGLPVVPTMIFVMHRREPDSP